MARSTGVHMNTGELLDLARTRQGTTDYGLAKMLGVGPSTISNYRVGRSHPDEVMAPRLAELAGLDPLQVVAWMQAERSRSEEGRATWRAIAERLAATAAGVCMCIGVGGGPDANITSLSHQPLTDDHRGSSVYYVNRLLRHLVRRAVDALQSLTPTPTGLHLA